MRFHLDLPFSNVSWKSKTVRLMANQWIIQPGCNGLYPTPSSLPFVVEVHHKQRPQNKILIRSEVTAHARHAEWGNERNKRMNLGNKMKNIK
jgi:hypothetical protein